MVTISRFMVVASLTAFASLAACNSEPETVTSEMPDPQATALANAAPVELPPAILASRTYRCTDNSLVYVDFYTNSTALVRTERGGAATILTSPEPGQPYVAEGYSVSANADEIRYMAPGAGTRSCHI